MYKAEIHMPDGIATISAPSIESIFSITYTMNFDIFVNGIQIKAKDGKKPGCNGYFAGVTRGRLAQIYESAK